MKLRKKARQYSLKKRHLALTSRESVWANSLKKLALNFLSEAYKLRENDEAAKRCLVLARLVCAKYFASIAEPLYIIPRTIHLDRDIESFNETQCWNFFGIRKEDLHRLFRSLRFPSVVKFENRSKMKGEEVFLRGLYELVNGENQYNISENVFGRDQSQQSRAFSFFITYLDETFYDLLSDNLQWWYDKGFIEVSRAAIQNKLEDLGLRFNEDYPQLVMGFIDCNCLEVCRVAGGPRGDGADALRYIKV